jgi:hypothetical protein
MGAYRKYRKNELNTNFQQKFAMGSYRVGLDMLGVYGKVVKYVVDLFKRENKIK